jgi:hypothetical protein
MISCRHKSTQLGFAGLLVASDCFQSPAFLCLAPILRTHIPGPLAPHALFGFPGLLLCGPVSRRVKPMRRVPSVDLQESGFHHLQVDVLAVKEDHSEDSAVLIGAIPLDIYGLVQNQSCKVLVRLRGSSCLLEPGKVLSSRHIHMVSG